MSRHHRGEESTDGGGNARLPLPAHPHSTRLSTSPLAAMSCKSCRQRKSKCSRRLPICESCQRHGFQCLYDAVPKKRVPSSQVVKNLLRRVHSLEQQQSAEQSPQQDKESGSPKTLVLQERDPISSVQAPGKSQAPSSNPEPDIPTRRELLSVFFTQIHGNPYTFVHEGSLRKGVLNSQTSKPFLHALCALCTSHTIHLSLDERMRRAGESLKLSEEYSPDTDFSIESIQTHIMQVLCLVVLGHGARAWMKLGAAIRIVQGLELHMETSSVQDTPVFHDLARLCVHTIYTMDRFSVCGSDRPMMFADETLQSLRLPCPEDISGLTTAGMISNPKFCELWVSGNILSQRQIVLHMFTSVVVLLGKCNQYLQTGGVQGDSHFPWHPMSKLSGLVNELGKWKDGVEAEINASDLDISQTTSVNRYYLSWFIYHTILVRLYRQFLPLISESGPDDLLDPWQQETSRKCVDHAVKISELCANANAHGYSWPYFTSFCLGCACTVLIHSAHYDFASSRKPHLVNTVEMILDMRRSSRLVDYQCDMLRKMHRLHVEMVRNYRAGTLVTTNLHLTQFYKRYPEGQFDQAHIPFSAMPDWMGTSLDGPDDLFAMEPLAARLGSLRGIPYTYQPPLDQEPGVPTQPVFSPRQDPSPFSPGPFFQQSHLYSPAPLSALDGYFEFEASGSRGILDTIQAEANEDAEQDLISSVLQQVSQGDFEDLGF